MPQVSKTTHDDPQQTHHGGAHHGGGRSWKPQGGQSAHKVNAVDQEGDEQEDPSQGAEEDLANLEAELQVLVTQAAKKRSQVERARGFSKDENPTGGYRK